MWFVRTCVCVCVCVCARVCLQCVCAVCVAMRFGVPTPARPPEVLHALRAAPCLRASSLPCYPRPPAHSSSLAGLRCAFGPPTSFFFRVTGRSARARVDGWFCLERVATCSELCGSFWRRLACGLGSPWCFGPGSFVVRSPRALRRRCVRRSFPLPDPVNPEKEKKRKTGNTRSGGKKGRERGQRVRG